MRNIQANDTSTEALLDGLIAECHAIIREVVLPSALAAPDDGERRRYLAVIAELARTGASVGDTVARLRGGGVSEARQRITVERIQSLSADKGRGV